MDSAQGFEQSLAALYIILPEKQLEVALQLLEVGFHSSL
jgi:hypothetical protein